MQADEIHSLLQAIFREVFLDEAIVITAEMEAKDVERWDSISHYDMLALVEDQFRITLTTREVASLLNVGDLLALIHNKVNA